MKSCDTCQFWTRYLISDFGDCSHEFMLRYHNTTQPGTPKTSTRGIVYFDVNVNRDGDGGNNVTNMEVKYGKDFHCNNFKPLP